MAFKIVITDGGHYTYNRCLAYLFDNLKSYQGAKRFIEDTDEAIHQLQYMADSFQICENKTLHAKGFRKIHFKHLSYKIFYHIINNTVYIDAFIHDRQDYENLLS